MTPAAAPPRAVLAFPDSRAGVRSPAAPASRGAPLVRLPAPPDPTPPGEDGDRRAAAIGGIVGPLYGLPLATLEELARVLAGPAPRVVALVERLASPTPAAPPPRPSFPAPLPDSPPPAECPRPGER